MLVKIASAFGVILSRAKNPGWVDTGPGYVDGVDNDNRAGEAREGSKRRRGLLAAKGSALEALQFSHCLLNARPQLVEHLGEEAPALLRLRA